MTIELKFRFKAIREILQVYKIELSELDKVVKDFARVGELALIGNKHAGGKLTLDEIEDMIDEDASLITYIMTEFQTQAAVYLTKLSESLKIPNEKSQLPLTN
jgi:hypothetical protein